MFFVNLKGMSLTSSQSETDCRQVKALNLARTPKLVSMTSFRINGPDRRLVDWQEASLLPCGVEMPSGWRVRGRMEGYNISGKVEKDLCPEIRAYLHDRPQLLHGDRGEPV